MKDGTMVARPLRRTGIVHVSVDVLFKNAVAAERDGHLSVNNRTFSIESEALRFAWLTLAQRSVFMRA